jgi:2',3'-cyclic-nucleotide 2'-phosphodiesterase/3'-nucleotidase/5'-nucleotidase
MVWAQRRDGYLGKIRVRIQREPSLVELVSYEAVPLEGEGDPAIAEAIEEWKARILEGAWKAVVGESTGTFSRARSADLIADSVRLAGRAEIAICNSEEILRPLPEGTITRRDLWALLPMDRHVVTFSITGAEVRALVEANLREGGALRFSGLRYTHDPSLPEGSQGVHLRVGRRTLDEKRPYRIAADEVTLTSVTVGVGQGGFQDTRKTVLGALEDYIESVGKTLDAEGDGRVTRRSGGPDSEMAR